MARGRVYSQQAIADCWELYKKYNGGHFDLIEKEMRAKGYVKWSRQNLVSRGQGKHRREGWVDLYNWEEALRQQIASQPLAALNSAQELVLEIVTIRKSLYKTILTTPDARQGGKAYSDLIYQHRDYGKLHAELLRTLVDAKDTLGGFVSFIERLLEILNRIGAEKAERELLKVSEQLIEEARREFGEEQDGLRPATSEPIAETPIERAGVN